MKGMKSHNDLTTAAMTGAHPPARRQRNPLAGLIALMAVIVFTVTFAIAVLVLFPIVRIFDSQRHSLHFIGILWAKCICFCNPWWKFHIHGRQYLAHKGQAVIYVANHQSQADILALFLLGIRFRWLAKNSLFKIPLFGWALSAIGYVPVKRGHKTSSEKCMQHAAAHLKNGTPMIFFPEGTRSKTGELGTFKTGAFRLAKSSQVPIIPISIEGCDKLLPKGKWLPSKAHVKVTIHPPLDSPSEVSLEEIMQAARRAILSGLALPSHTAKKATSS